MITRDHNQKILELFTDMKQNWQPEEVGYFVEKFLSRIAAGDLPICRQHSSTHPDDRIITMNMIRTAVSHKIQEIESGEKDITHKPLG
tara:strand:+ start:2460 stop:2723 length:264 start_codon:yes stop_codon:yes gene_type:complete